MIEIAGLNAGYGKLVILHDVNLTIAEKRITAILGANGSGKSTLLKTIFGLTTVFDGSIRFDGREIVGMPTEAINGVGMAYVPQRLNVFTSMSVRDNLLLASRALTTAYDLFPILRKRQHHLAGQLSGGERQMLAIALAWLTDAHTMMLDEPTAGLSPLMAKSIFETLAQMRDSGSTLAVVEQNARIAVQYADDVIVLREGRVIYSGTAADFASDEERQKNYLGIARTV